MKKDRHSVYAIGTPTIVVVLIVLCLITFAALSLVSAKADYKLSKTYAESTNYYYKASGKAQKKIKEIDARLNELYKAMGPDAFLQAAATDGSIALLANVYESEGSYYASFEEEISDKSLLDVVLKLKNPGANSECFDIVSYKQVAANEWKADDNINVFIPE